jgi:hypothetical protein
VVSGGRPDQPQTTVSIFHKRRAVFHPVTGVAVGESLDIKCHGFVDMPTDNAVTAAPAGVTNDEFADAANVTGRDSQQGFESGGE